MPTIHEGFREPAPQWYIGNDILFDRKEHDVLVNYLQEMFKVLTTEGNPVRWEEYGVCNDIKFPMQIHLDSRNLVGMDRIEFIRRSVLDDITREQIGGGLYYDTETVKMLHNGIIYHKKVGPRNFMLACCALVRLYRRIGRAQEAQEMVQVIAQKIDGHKYQLTPFEYLQNMDTETRRRVTVFMGHDPFDGIVNVEREIAFDKTLNAKFQTGMKPGQAFGTRASHYYSKRTLTYPDDDAHPVVKRADTLRKMFKIDLKLFMRSFSKLAAIVLLAPFAFAAPSSELETRQTIDTSSHCGQWDSVVAGQYTLYLDQWGLSGASSGSDCASLTSLSGTTIAWKNTWNWVGGNGVKSYTNINLNSGLNKKLSAVSSIPATWKWSQSNSGTVVANIAFDLFTSASSGGSNANEIMIWLANYNAGPISAVYNSDGTPQPKASNVSLAGRTWNLYFGSNGANNVYSFLPTGGATVTSFSADLNLFLKYLTSSQGLSTSQFLTTVQSGTEATSGSATFTS
ncbi:hypothetical protein DXG01_004331 [Tephrocybe rancida]|nr:hypothetical protein DXG01_004331 [Tephrocybe rancida]